DRIEFLQGDMLEPFDFAQGKPYKIDLIVSNPPYVPTQELIDLAAAFPPPPRHQAGLPLIQGGEIRRGLIFEPRSALDGGPDGLDFVRQIQASKIPSIIETIGGKIIER
ncbi:MAG TPA: hypothetical protein VJI96_03755, partial [Candidatus Andersenbacteria bacterium]|nr:hypothetical protein [Candidatus Andersenbacteria bacterium]